LLFRIFWFHIYLKQLLFINLKTNTMKRILFAFSIIFALMISANNTMAQTRRKGMSSQAKGALIGGGAGAIAGGLIGHNVGGAVLGAAVGAGGGYVVGNEVRRKKVKQRRAYYRAHHYQRTYVRHR
jgi:hypothetical protein